MSENEQVRTVKVRLHLPPGVKPMAGAMLHLKVEDVSFADRAAPVIAETVSGYPADNRAEIDVPVALVDPTMSYSLFLHISIDGSTRIETGDFISPQVHPVLTHEGAQVVEATLIRVGKPG